MILFFKKMLAMISLGFTLITYQNCGAPQNELSDEDILSTSAVTGIDQVNVGSIFFPQSKVSPQVSEKIVYLDGVCDQNGAIISWQLKNIEGVLIERGQSQCNQGAFTVELSQELQNFCQESLILKASLGAKAASQMTVTPSCSENF